MNNDDFGRRMKQLNEILVSGNYSAFNRLEPEDLISGDLQKKLTSLAYKLAGKKHSHTCLYPGCDCYAINSHSVPRAMLRKLSNDDNKVVTLSVFPEFKADGKIDCEPEKVGVNNASIFEGFCREHDKELFSCVEDKDVSIDNNEQMFFLLYRSVCREYLRANDSYEIMKKLFEKIPGEINSDEFLQLANFSNLYSNLCSLHWLRQNKIALDMMLANEQKEHLSDVFEIGRIEMDYIPLGVNACISVIAAKHDIHYEDVDIRKNELPFFSFTSIPNQSSDRLFLYYFCKKDQAKMLKPFLRYWESSDKVEQQAFVTDTIIRNSENFYLGPDFWDSIPEKDKKKILDIFYHTVKDKLYELDNDLNFWSYKN